MTTQSNSKYLEKYSRMYSEMVCDRFFSSRQFMTGPDIIKLTDSVQVNFFVVKRLFELWQEELEKLKSNPFFDYRDVSVHEVLTAFMNVLSRRIKVDRINMEPLVQTAVSQAILLALDPVSFYHNEVSNAPAGKVNQYLRENKKYYKWHVEVIAFLIDKTGLGYDKHAYLEAITTNYGQVKDALTSIEILLSSLEDPIPFDLLAHDKLTDVDPASEVNNQLENPSQGDFLEDGNPNHSLELKPILGENLDGATDFSNFKMDTTTSSQLDLKTVKASFETESYKWMPGIIGTLADSLTLNQRFMLAKELFSGDVDKLKEALHLIDSSSSFDEAVNLVSTRYVDDLGWDTHSDAVNEFLQLIYRRFPV